MLRFVTNKRRTGGVPALLLIVLLVLGASLALAQDAGRALVSSVPITGTLDAERPAQVYYFTGGAGSAISLAAASADGIALSIVVTDTQGNLIASAADTAGLGQTNISGTVLTADGTYFVTVFPTPGVETAVSGVFTLTLLISDAGELTQPQPTTAPLEAEVTAQAEAEVTAQADLTAATPVPAVVTPAEFAIGQTILSQGGIVVNLRWETGDDLNLQVRDPAGESLFWDSRTTTSGGTFGFDVNGLCQVVTPTGNVETASWPTGPVTTGSYEVLVYYRQACVGSSPVDFILDISVDNVPLPSITGAVLPPLPGTDSVFITSFKIADDAALTAGISGPYIDTRVLDVTAAELLERVPNPLTFGEPVQGVITSEQPYQTYQFDGESGQAVSITMTREIGSLDTLLLVLDSAGNIIDGNDDIQVAVNTNSALPLLRLPATDRYTIVATRYGKLVGGTEGTFTLQVSGQTTLVLPQEIVDLALPQGDIQIILTWDSTADLRLLVRDPALNSIFNDEPTSPTGGRLQEVGNLNCNLSLSPTPLSYIYWPTGLLRIGSYEVDVLHRSECGTSLPTNFNLYVSVAGTLASVQSGTLTLGQRYLTSFTINDTAGATSVTDGGLLGDSTTLNYQGDAASAVSIADAQRVTGTITFDNTFDLYTFEGLAGDVVTVTMTSSNGNLDPLLYLIAPSGIEIAQNDDSNETTNSAISEILLTEDGLYTIIATRFGANFGGTSGAYNLQLRIDRP